jgi:hypothetical protein
LNVLATLTPELRDTLRAEKLNSGSSMVEAKPFKAITGRTEPLKSLLMENHQPSE